MMVEPIGKIFPGDYLAVGYIAFGNGCGLGVLVFGLPYR
jgi:hypothetical protein